MPLPSDKFDSAASKIDGFKTYKEVSAGIKELKEKGSNFEAAAKDKVQGISSKAQGLSSQAEGLASQAQSTIASAKDKAKQFQQQATTQLDQLLQLISLNTGNSSGTVNALKGIFNKVIIATYKRIPEILLQEAINAVGCSQQQEFQPQVLYIKVPSIDLLNILFLSPDEPPGRFCYEKAQPQNGLAPFAMNKLLNQLLNQENVPFPGYIGFSGKELFDIEYVTVDDQGNFGDFYKVTLKNRLSLNGQVQNKVGDFIVDYYKSIRIFDVASVYQLVMDLIMNSFSISANIGTKQVELKSKFEIILQRILGLCFDNTNEIDIAGTSKVSETDAIDESFFQFTDIDLRNIETKLSNISQGVIEFESCENVKLPVDTELINSQLDLLFDADNLEDQIEIANNLTDVIADKWKNLLTIPYLDFKLSLDLSFIKELPKALCTAILSPKVLLPIMIMIKALQQQLEAVDIEDFLKKFKKFIINFMSKLGAIFLEELFKVLKKEIRKLIASIISDIQDERVQKAYLIISQLVEVIEIVVSLIKDYRSCKSLIDEILALLRLAGNLVGNQLPFPLAFGAQLRSGTSGIRSFINTIEEMQKLGIPTGPMPDGSPNLGIISMFSQLQGQEKESAQNSKTTTALPALTVLPVMVTQPDQADGLIQ
jgi:hypothetical protein